MRNELKFLDSYGQLTHFVSQKRAFRPYPPRRINSVYFDTHDLKYFVESEEGSVPRYKVRFRWYGDGEVPSDGTFEIKKTFATFRDKDTVRVSNIKRQELAEYASRMIGTTLLPTVMISYDRDYFLDNSGHRYTIDRSITYKLCDRNLLVVRTSVDPRIVLECKFNLSVDYSDKTAAFGHCRTRFSKYCEAIKSVL